jgi:hypothetical protein
MAYSQMQSRFGGWNTDTTVSSFAKVANILLLSAFKNKYPSHVGFMILLLQKNASRRGRGTLSLSLSQSLSLVRRHVHLEQGSL